MKKITYSVAFVATLLATSNTFAQQGFGTNTPHRSAAVEIKSSNKGLLIPRVALNSETQKLNTSVDNANSLMVFNESGSLPKGYYYWNETTPANGSTPAVGTWVLFATGNSVSALNGQNAVTRNGNFFELGGDLNRNTEINFGTKNFTLNLNTGKFIINNLVDITDGLSSTTRPSMNLLVQNTDSNSNGEVRAYTPSRLLADYLIGTNGVNVGFNSLSGNTEVKLGGDLTEDTTIGTLNKVFRINTGTEAQPNGAGIRFQEGGLYVDNIQGWHETTQNTPENMVVAVGNMETNQMSAATTKQVVKAGLEPENGIKWNDAANANDSKLVLGGALTQATTITTDATNTLAIDGMTVNTNQQLGGKHVVLADATTGVLSEVAISDLVESAQANIVGEGAIKVVAANNTNTVSVTTGNGIQQYGTGADAYIGIGGTVTEDTTLTIANGASVKVQGLQHISNNPLPGAISNDQNQTTSVTDLSGNLVAVGNAITGELKVATAQDIVNAGIVEIKHDINTDTNGDKLLKTTINGTEFSNEINLSEIVESGFSANNGLTKTNDLVQLGGALTQPTVIRTNVTETTVGEYTETSANTLAIDGLQNASTGNKRILIERVGEGANAHDVLRTVERNIIVEGLTEPTNAVNYEEITYIVTTGGNLALPAASAKGQIINIIIKQNLTDLLFINGAGEALVSADLTSAGITGASTNTLAYGEMLGQRWTLKSDGSKWIITARM